VYGPGDIAHAHAVDERVSIDEIATVARVLEAAVRRLLQ
jgi:acetylornithine deacetylase/succinyl-diaminopimelate desuccinylase-like protein